MKPLKGLGFFAVATSCSLFDLTALAGHSDQLNSFGIDINHNQNTALNTGINHINKMAGCYLVDYNYKETKSLKDGYVPDERVYDVNHNQSIKELILADQISPTQIRLQHILFVTTLDGKVMDGSVMKHQAEDWEYNSAYRYEFAAPNTWVWQVLDQNSNLWTRRITNLDDGLRYQCSSEWSADVYPQWTCDNFAPIPGRETRDMGRKDYNTLERSTTLVIYGNSWLERQSNTKIIYSDNQKTPLAKEEGKNWYVRLPDAECDVAKEFAEPRLVFWDLVRETRDEVFAENKSFIEQTPANMPPRYVLMWDIEKQALAIDLTDVQNRQKIKNKIKSVINTYRI